MAHVIEATETDKVLADMFTENTGRHMLDSGGAYGRNWERNVGRDVESFLSAPEVTIDRWGCVTVDAFHWLRDRVEYDARWDRVFRLWTALDEDANGDHYWLESMERFAARVESGDAEGRITSELGGTFNTYNGEDSLSQTLQFAIFSVPAGHWCDGGQTLLLLQVHGGCDVRGGYTAPRVFRLGGWDGAADMLDWDLYTLACSRDQSADTPLPGMPQTEPHVIDRRNGEWITYGGSFTSDPWDGAEPLVEPDDAEPFIRCPYCEDPTPMIAYSYPVG